MTRQDRNGEQPAASRLLLAVRREPNAVVLVLASGEDLELAPESVPDDLPAPGGELTGEMLSVVRAAAARKRAARRIFGLLDRRLVPPARLRRKLAEEGHPSAAVEAILEQMAARGLYSDRFFADTWCRDALRTRAVGRRWLESRLWTKGVAGPVAKEAAAAALDTETEVELAHEAAAARWRRHRGPVDRRAEARIVRYLQSRGFGGALAGQAMRATRPGPGPGNDDDEERS